MENTFKMFNLLNKTFIEKKHPIPMKFAILRSNNGLTGGAINQSSNFKQTIKSCIEESCFTNALFKSLYDGQI